MCHLQIPPDFCPWLWILKKSQEKWPLSRFQTNSALHFPVAAWDVLNTLLTLRMAHVQQFWSRKYQTEMWESLLFEIEMLAGRWCPWEFAGSGCFRTSKPKRTFQPHITRSLAACTAGAFRPIFSNCSIKLLSSSHLCCLNVGSVLQLKWNAHKIWPFLNNAKTPID